MRSQLYSKFMSLFVLLRTDIIVILRCHAFTTVNSCVYSDIQGHAISILIAFSSVSLMAEHATHNTWRTWPLLLYFYSAGGAIPFIVLVRYSRRNYSRSTCTIRDPSPLVHTYDWKFFNPIDSDRQQPIAYNQK